MPAQRGDSIVGERLGIKGKVTAGEIADLGMYYTPLNGRYRVENAEVNSYNSNYGPYYGNHATDLGNYPLNFTSQPTSLQQGHMNPYRSQLDRMKLWWRTNNTNIVTKLILWKQLKFADSTAENNTLLWESADLQSTASRSQFMSLTAADFGTVVIEENEIWALSCATINNDGAVRYFYIMGGGAWWLPA